MPPKDWTLRLEDMLDAAEKVERYTVGIADLEAFISNELVVDAVIRNVQIIGEAARHIPDDARVRYPDFDWVGMQGMRNILVHDYAALEQAHAVDPTAALQAERERAMAMELEP